MNTEIDDDFAKIISEISVTPVRPRNTLVAFCSLAYRGEIFLGDIALHVDPSSDDFRLVFPEKVLFNGSRCHVHFPLSSKVNDTIRAAIVAKYKELIP